MKPASVNVVVVALLVLYERLLPRVKVGVSFMSREIRASWLSLTALVVNQPITNTSPPRNDMFWELLTNILL